ICSADPVSMLVTAKRMSRPLGARHTRLCSKRHVSPGEMLHDCPPRRLEPTNSDSATIALEDSRSAGDFGGGPLRHPVTVGRDKGALPLKGERAPRMSRPLSRSAPARLESVMKRVVTPCHARQGRDMSRTVATLKRALI